MVYATLNNKFAGCFEMHAAFHPQHITQLGFKAPHPASPSAHLIKVHYI